MTIKHIFCPTCEILFFLYGFSVIFVPAESMFNNYHL